MAESQNRTLTEQFMLRLPDGMRERIKRKAEDSGRSMNAEVVAALELWLNAPSERQQRKSDLERHRTMLLMEAEATRLRLEQLIREAAEIDSALRNAPDTPDDS